MSPALPLFVVSTKANTADISKRVKAGELQRVVQGLYTRDMRPANKLSTLVGQHIWEIVGLLCPGALIVDRTALEARPADDGSIFVVSGRTSDLAIPGFRIRTRKGVCTAQDLPFMGGTLRMSSAGRIVLDNMVPSRARSGPSRTAGMTAIEEYLERQVRLHGDSALNRIRDEAKSVAVLIGREAEMDKLDRLCGALLGTQPSPAGVTAPTAVARIDGAPYDDDRVAMFERLWSKLHSEHFPMLSEPTTAEARANVAFFESYFSNFIEGTEFEVSEAENIVFGNQIPPKRPQDAHDILGTWRVASDEGELAAILDTFESFEAALKRRHSAIMEGRPEKAPGIYKEIANRAGTYEFVAPDLVRGTLKRGYEFLRALADPFARAAFAMFVVSEVHPFLDGNGRVARLMMNGELARSRQARIIIPTIMRNDYLDGLRGLSANGNAESYLRILAVCRNWSAPMPWDSFPLTKAVMTRTNAYLRHQEAVSENKRLTVPTPSLISAIEIVDVQASASRPSTFS